MTRLGRYSILHELGAGCTGTVYRARDNVMGREVALKVIADFKSLDIEFRERFYREARAGAKLKHDNVVTIFDFGEEGGNAFIAMEFLRGSDLGALLSLLRRYHNPIHFKGGAPLDTAKKIEIIAAVCDGLQHAHNRLVIHREIKPGNIFVTEDGIPKILDFGAARLPTAPLTVARRVVGAPNYMAPEQILGQRCDARSDQFSLAIVAFEFLTGVHPFSSHFIPDRIVNGCPDSLLSRNPNLPAGLEPVLARALARDPAQRYNYVADFAAALRSCHSSGTTGPQPLEAPRINYDTAALLPALVEFDAAIGRSDAAGARRALAAIARVAGEHPGFSDALRQYELRLAEFERASGGGALPRPPI